MSNPNPFSNNKWSRPNTSTYGLHNSWYQSKSGRHLRRRQQLDFIQRELRREKEAQLGSCIKQISKDCKEMLKKKMEEIMQYNNTINQPQSINNAQNRFRRYKCFHCKQRGHILKFCPMDDKNKDMATKRDTSEFAKETKEVIKPTKPSVMLKYPECIHFSTTCMIKGTDHANWDDIWYISNQTDKHLCYKLDFFCNIKENFMVNKLDNQMKLLFTYGIGEVVIKDGGQGYLIPGVHYAPEVTLNILSMDLLEKQGFEITYENNRCSLGYMFNNTKNQKLDEDKMRTMHNKYLLDNFESLAKKDTSSEEDLIQIKEFGIIGEILGLSKENGEDIKNATLNTWMFSHLTTKLQGSHNKNTRLFLRNLQGKIIEPSTSRKSDIGDSGSNTSDDFTIIT
ncbi:ARID DNA-binding domain-containing protein [Tanacetum coccineum]